VKFWPATTFIFATLLIVVLCYDIKFMEFPMSCDLSSIESKIVDFHDKANARILEQGETILRLQDKLNFAEGKMGEAEDRVQELERQRAEK